MDIFEYTLATGKLRQLSDCDGYDAECAYSPDGKHIVFSSFRDYDQEIYICDADGGNPRRITYAKGADGSRSSVRTASASVTAPTGAGTTSFNCSYPSSLSTRPTR